MKLKSTFLIFFIEIILFEIITRCLIFGNLFSINLIYIIVFTIPITLILTLLTKILPKGFNRALTILYSLIITVYFIFQYIFYRLFSIPFSFYTIELANQAFDFIDIIKDALKSNIFPILLMIIPLILSIIFTCFTDYKRYNKEQVLSYIILIIMSIGIETLYLFEKKDRENSPYNLYFKVDNQLALIDQFGLLTYTTIDIKRATFGFEIKDYDLIIDETPVVPPTIEEIKYGNNILDIDFNKLIADSKNKNLISLHEYFRDSEPTNKNMYTGMFQGKNLIFILAEGFNEIAVDQERTPTLYKLIHEGFNFTNFYSPVFLSTTGGEFQATTGLIPTQEILKTWKSTNPSMLYSLGHTFSNVGYTTNAFHDWTYTYYRRDITMKTLGYDNYMGCFNGMEKLLSCNWLPSDTEMINVTSPMYMNESKFLTYYVTVSGHSPYVKGANIVNKYYNLVEDLDISSNTKSYLASQVELDRAVEQLIKNLEVNGQLDNTVIALVGDHYPYTLKINEINEASNYEKDEIVEVNHSNFIIWNNGMKPVIVNKTGSQIDVLPTLLNLFGIEYDSRIIVGKDILSDYEGLAIFSNRSWVTDKGTYYANRRKFIPNEGIEVDKGYVERINRRVSNAFVMSKLIMDNDYYVKIKE